MTRNHDPFSPKAAVKKQTGPAAEASQESASTPVETERPSVSPETTENGVPRGTSVEVADWVNGDKERAQQALDAEYSSGEPRRGLVKKLQEILA